MHVFVFVDQFYKFQTGCVLPKWADNGIIAEATVLERLTAVINITKGESEVVLLGCLLEKMREYESLTEKILPDVRS